MSAHHRSRVMTLPDNDSFQPTLKSQREDHRVRAVRHNICPNRRRSRITESGVPEAGVRRSLFAIRPSSAGDRNGRKPVIVDMPTTIAPAGEIARGARALRLWPTPAATTAVAASTLWLLRLSGSFARGAVVADGVARIALDSILGERGVGQHDRRRDLSVGDRPVGL